VLAELKARALVMRHDHALRGLLGECRRLLSERGEANGPAIAASIVERIESLADDRRARFFDHLARDFSPDPKAVLESAQAYALKPGAEQLMRLTQVTEPPRQELFRRLNRAPGGTAAIVRLRRSLLERLPRQPQLQAVESDLLHLLSSWFNAGFLQMRRVDWNSPAQLLEQIIRHEAVHEIDGWDDLRRRLQPDRRCFAFFHPQLPDEPLIFVEVALLPEMASAIAPLIDKKSVPASSDSFKVAVFYSISNCQPGLRNVSLGNFLIKRVADELKRELPQLKTFCTLSPIPSLLPWLVKAKGFADLPGIKPQQAERAADALAQLRKACGDDLAALAGAQRTAIRRAPGAVAAGRHLPRVCIGHRARRSGGALPPRQRRAARAAERQRQPVVQGAQAVGRTDGQLPLRPVAHRDLPRSFRARSGGTFARTFGAAVVHPGLDFNAAFALSYTRRHP
jgi:malonyl-CoA decarboxylase